MTQVTLFISTVSREFASYREALRKRLTLPNVAVKIQEDFKDGGQVITKTLADYIRHCDAVIHFAGRQTGFPAAKPDLAGLRELYPDLAARLPDLADVLGGSVAASYTQWEAYLAVLHGKKLFIVQPGPDVEPDKPARASTEPVQTQADHLARLRKLGRYPAEPGFASAADLEASVAIALVNILRQADGTDPVQVHNLPFRSLGRRLNGRDELLRTLHDRLCDPAGLPVLALCGLGGVGKTRLAIEYAWRYGTTWPALLFVTADTPAALQANLAALAGPEVLDLPAAGAAPPKADRPRNGQANKQPGRQDGRLRAVLDWLRRHPGWLLILDNVDTQEAAAAAEAWLPRLDKGRVLLTTRLDEVSPQVESLALGVLSEAAATEFLLACTGHRRPRPTDAADARRLAGLLGGLALALEQAGAYVNARRISLHAYLQHWEANEHGGHAGVARPLPQYPPGVAVTWQTSFAQLGTAAHTLLNRLAWLAPDPVPRSLLTVPVPDAPPLDAEAALVELVRYSLASLAGDGESLTVHPLVQEVTRARQAAREQAAAGRAALQWLSAAFAGDPLDVRTWPVLGPLQPHALALARQQPATDHPQLLGALLTNLGLLLYRQARFADAEPLLRRALTLHPAPDAPEVATSLNNLALLLQDTGRAAKAEPLLRRALALNEAHYGPTHPEVATSLRNLTLLLVADDRLAEAEPLLRRALAILAAAGPGHPEVAASLQSLAALLLAADRPAEAKPLLYQALALGEASGDRPLVATILYTLASLYQDAEKYTRAKHLYQQALAIDEALYGPTHPEVTKGLNNLALLFDETGKPAKAEPLLRRALALNEAHYGPTHPEVATNLYNLALLLRDTGRPAEAEPLLRRVLAIEAAHYGPAHPEIATDLKALAKTLEALGRPHEAGPLRARAQAIRRAHPS